MSACAKTVVAQFQFRTVLLLVGISGIGVILSGAVLVDPGL
jgi:hypothetical protein